MPGLRKSPRLKGFDYKGYFAYFVTVVTRGRLPVFAEAAVVDLVTRALKRSLNTYEFKLYAYCFMPDHLHLLLSGIDSRSLKGFMQHFKQLSGYRYKQESGRALWQISYYDRVLRSDEGIEQIAKYIWGNPVRAGMVEFAGEYPFSGPRALLDP